MSLSIQQKWLNWTESGTGVNLSQLKCYCNDICTFAVGYIQFTIFVCLIATLFNDVWIFNINGDNSLHKYLISYIIFRKYNQMCQTNPKCHKASQLYNKCTNVVCKC